MPFRLRVDLLDEGTRKARGYLAEMATDPDRVNAERGAAIARLDRKRRPRKRPLESKPFARHNHVRETTMTNLIERHRDEVAALCRRAGARRLDAFGSAVRDDFDPATSDLDFLVEFDEVAPAGYAQAYFTLKEGLETLFGRPVDLVTGSSLANPYFRERITAERRNVYAR